MYFFYFIGLFSNTPLQHISGLRLNGSLQPNMMRWDGIDRSGCVLEKGRGNFKINMENFSFRTTCLGYICKE